MSRLRLVFHLIHSNNVSITIVIDIDITAYGACENSVLCWL